MKLNGARIIGIGLILIGLLSILTSMGITDIRFWEFWPFIILVFGLMFEAGYFFGDKKDVGLLVPGGIFITISAIFIVNVLFGWHTMEYLWPLFIMAPGIGMLQMYLFNHKKMGTGILIPISISLLLGTYFLLGSIFYFVNFSVIMSIIIIIIGLLLIIKKSPNQSNSQ